MREAQVPIVGLTRVSPHSTGKERVPIFQLLTPLMLLLLIPSVFSCVATPSITHAVFNMSSGDCLYFTDLDITINSANTTVLNITVLNITNMTNVINTTVINTTIQNNTIINVINTTNVINNTVLNLTNFVQNTTVLNITNVINTTVQNTTVLNISSVVNTTVINTTVQNTVLNITNTVNVINTTVINTTMQNITSVVNTTVQNITVLNVMNTTVQNTTVLNITSVINTTVQNITMVNVINTTVQNTTVLNITSVINTTVQNITSVVNTTVQNTTVLNITSVINTTVQSCPVVNQTIWANSSTTQNNATITCLSNAHVEVIVQNITNTTSPCNLTLNITPSATPYTYFNLEKNISLNVSAIPPEWCLENRVETYSEIAIVRSEKANNTFYFTPSCPVCAQAPQCPAAPAGEYYLASGENRSWGELRANCAQQTSFSNYSNLTAEDLFNGTERTKVFVSVNQLAGVEETQAALRQDGDELIRLKTFGINTQLEMANTRMNGPNGLSQRVIDLREELEGWKNGKHSNDGIYLALAVALGVAAVFIIWQKAGAPYYNGLRKQPNPTKMKEAVDKLGKAAEED